MTQNSHPKTYFVMKVAARVGEVVMMHLKRKYNRPRPSQMFPLVVTARGSGHSAYPAGHALIARLTANVLKSDKQRGCWLPLRGSAGHAGHGDRLQPRDRGISLQERHQGR